MTQLLRPIADIAANGWTPSSGSDLFAMVDESTPNDSDYIRSPNNPTTQQSELKYGPGTGTHSTCTTRARLQATGEDSDFDLNLVQGTTVLDSWTESVTVAEGKVTREHVSTGISITNAADLRTRHVARPLISGPTYYVSPTGSNAADGSLATPFQTIQYACNAAIPGDTICLLDGVYSVAGDRILQVNNSGTAGARITVRAQNQWGAILDGDDYTTDYGIVPLNAGNYYTFDGLQLRRFRHTAFWMFGSSTTKVHDIIVTNCLIHDIGRWENSDCGTNINPSGVYANGDTYNVEWHHNIWHDIGRVPHLACDANLGTTPNYRHDHAMYLQGKYHNVHHDIFYNMHAGWAIKCDGYYDDLTNPSDPSHWIHECTFAHPMVPRESTGHIRFFSNGQTGGTPEQNAGRDMQKAKNVLIENCISYLPPYWSGAGASSPGPTMAAVLYDGVFWHVGTVVRNCLTTAASVIDEASAGSTENAKVTRTANQVGVTASSLFTDAAANDFTLKVDSPARNAGVGGIDCGAIPYEA